VVRGGTLALALTLTLTLTLTLALNLTLTLTVTLTLTRYERGAFLRSEDCVCAAATVLSALQAFDLSALQPSSGLLDMDNPFATRNEYS
jgi:hypothetical protein